MTQAELAEYWAEQIDNILMRGFEEKDIAVLEEIQKFLLEIEAGL
jgi:hypothetical protein